MKRLRLIQTNAILAICVFLISANTNGALVITEAMPNSGHGGGVANGDWWELTNTGAATVDLGGYYWDDDPAGSNDGAIFPAFMLAPGASVVIADENDGPGFVAAYCGGFDVIAKSDMDASSGNTFSGLGSGGDSIMLWDHNPVLAGDVPVASVTFGAATSGQSFQWSTTGVDLGLSETGVNGGFVACSDGAADPGMGTAIGSPGVAVPEPAGLLSGLLGLLSFLVMRRR